MKRVRVGDVLELQRRPVRIDPESEYALVGVYSFGKGIFHRTPQLGIELGDYKFSSVQPGDLVLSNIQAWEGAIAFATEADRNTVGTQRFLSYTARDPDVIDTNWARYYFLSPAGFPHIQKAAPGSVTPNRTLSRSRFEAIEIDLPVVDEQRQVASHLARVSELTAAFHRSREAQRTEALVSSLATRPDLRDSAKGKLGWRRLSLRKIMKQSNESVSVRIDGKYPNLGIYSFGRGVFGKPPIEGTTTSAKQLSLVRAGQLIYSRLFAFEGAYAFVPEEFDGHFVSNEFPSFDVDPELATAEFIAAALRSRQQWNELAGSSKGLGLRRQRIKVEALLEHELWFPPIEEQHRVVAALRKLEQVNGLVAKFQALAAAVLPSALNRAFAGLA